MKEVLNPGQWQKLESVYRAALQVPQGQRPALLTQICSGDEELRREAESLLAADDAANDFLQSSVATLALKIVAREEHWRNDMNSETTIGYEGALPVGMVLDDRYRIERKLGEGGMSDVYQAHALRLDQPVAVKVLKEGVLNNGWVVDKFQQEVKALAKVNHPSVIRILDSGALPNDGSPYLVMQYVAGSDLRHLIEESVSGLEANRVAMIMRQAGSGVTALHEAGLVHRDIKPGNFMWADKDRDFPIKVIDLCIVRVLETDTRLDQTPGTPLYLSPEQINRQDVTPASDVYALGLMSYELLVGRSLFDELKGMPRDQFWVCLSKLQQDIVKVKPEDLLPYWPNAARVILEALALNPEQRPTAQQFGDKLAEALTPSPIIVRDSIARHLVSWLISNKRWLIPAAALVTVIAFTLWLWKPFGRTLAATEVVETRIEGKKENSETKKPTALDVYELDGSYPTGPPPSGMVYATIGLNVFRTRPVNATDGADTSREIVDGQEVASERTETYVTNGEKLYLSIESLTGNFLPDKGGYLYVVNREQYADRTYGRARLIFPTLLTYSGNNLVKPGQPIVLPRSKGEPFFVKRSNTNHTAETFTIILSPWVFQLPEPLSDKAMVLPDYLFADWEKQYGTKMYRATLRGGAGQTKTKREQEVGNREITDGAESLLTRDDPSPQTVFKGAVKNGNPAMVTVALPFKN